MPMESGLAAGIANPAIEAVIGRVQAASTTMLPDTEDAPCAVGVAALVPQPATNANIATSASAGTIAPRTGLDGSENLIDS